MLTARIELTLGFVQLVPRPVTPDAVAFKTLVLSRRSSAATLSIRSSLSLAREKHTASAGGRSTPKRPLAHVIGDIGRTSVKLIFEEWGWTADIAQSPEACSVLAGGKPTSNLRADSDRNCVLNAGDHPSINHESAVAYEYGRIWTKDQIKALEASSLFPQMRRKQASAQLVQRIQQGALQFDQTSLEYRSRISRGGNRGRHAPSRLSPARG